MKQIKSKVMRLFKLRVSFPLRNTSCAKPSTVTRLSTKCCRFWLTCGSIWSFKYPMACWYVHIRFLSFLSLFPFGFLEDRSTFCIRYVFIRRMARARTPMNHFPRIQFKILVDNRNSLLFVTTDGFRDRYSRADSEHNSRVRPAPGFPCICNNPVRILILVLRILYRSQTPKHIDKKARGIRVVFMYFDISFHKPSRIWTVLPSHMWTYTYQPPRARKRCPKALPTAPHTPIRKSPHAFEFVSNLISHWGC